MAEPPHRPFHFQMSGETVGYLPCQTCLEYQERFGNVRDFGVAMYPAPSDILSGQKKEVLKNAFDLMGISRNSFLFSDILLKLKSAFPFLDESANSESPPHE